MNLLDVTDRVLPDESNPESLRRWRLRIAAVACSNWLFTFLVLVPILLGLLFLGFPVTGKVAFAAEQEKRVAKVEGKVDTILKLSLSGRMREIQQEICATESPSVKRILEATRDDLQHEYREVAGEFYPLVINCQPT